ncbi:MAG TPA: serine/threonine protein kinase, partial [Streptomyces sp.]|nr:serine/threonine protein kinase [Streptomyces sp.]
RRRIRLGVATAVLAAGLGLGGWLALSGDSADEPPDGSEHSAPAGP